MQRVVSRGRLGAKIKPSSMRGLKRSVKHTDPSGSIFDVAKLYNGDCAVCIIRSVSGIGDVLMTTPGVRELKKHFPNIHITYACDRRCRVTDIYYQLIKNAPFIDEIIDARYVDRSKYAAVKDISAICIPFERSDLPNINRIDLFARSLGIPYLTNKMPFYKVEPDEHLYAQRLLQHLRPNSIVALHTASFEEKRSWPIEKYISIVERSIRDNLPVKYIIFDFNRKFDNWAKYPNCYDASNASIREKAALIQQCDLFIGPDSGLMHLAGALRTKSYVIFGSVPPQARINYYRTHEAIRLEGLPCLGCWYKKCPIDVKCMRELDAEIVYNKILASLGVRYVNR